MPPKRKATTTTVDPPTASTRKTRSSKATAGPATTPPTPAPSKPKAKPKVTKPVAVVESDDEPTPQKKAKKVAAPAAAAATAKGKSKKKKKVVLPVSSDDDDSQVAAVPTKSSTKPTTIAQAYTYKDVTGTTSTSTTPLPDASTSTSSKGKPSPKKQAVVKKVAVSFEQGCKEWFEEFQDPDEVGRMNGEGVEKLFSEMDVSMDGPLPFILAWKVNAKPGTFGSYYLEDFLTAFRADKITSTPLLKTYLTKVSDQIFSPTSPIKDYKAFYKFLFTFVKEEGQKSLNGEIALAVWSVVLVPKFKLAGEVVEYALSLGTNFKGVSSDVWNQLLEFLENVGGEAEDYNEEDAWPAILDAFVEWRKEKV